MSQRANKNRDKDDSSSICWQLFLMAVAAAYVPFDAYFQSAEGVSLMATIGVSVAVVSASIALRWILTLAGADGLATSMSISVGVLLLSASGPLVGDWDSNHFLVVLAAATTVLLVYRTSHHWFVQAVVTWTMFSVVLLVLATPVMALFSGSPTNRVRVDPVLVQFDSKNDVVILLADAYPGSAVLSELYDFDNSGFQHDLRDLGFSVGDIATNYSLTTFSVPSLLQMAYVASEGVVDESGIAELLGVIGGANSFSASLKNAGYQTIYVESGWMGTQCGLSVDVCVSSPFPPEPIYDMAYRSILRNLSGFETGIANSRGAQHSLTWLSTELESYLRNGSPDYVYVHVLAPHPPLFFDQACDMQPSVELSGFGVTYPDLSTAKNELRRQAFVSGVECVNRAVLDLARIAVETDTTMVFLGDHGPDGHLQFSTQIEEWSALQIEERMTTTAAAWTSKCAPRIPPSLVDLLPSVISCINGTESHFREPRRFLADVDPNGLRLLEISELSADMSRAADD